MLVSLVAASWLKNPVSIGLLHGDLSRLLHNSTMTYGKNKTMNDTDYEIDYDGFVAHIYLDEYGAYAFQIRHWHAPIIAIGHACFTLDDAKERVYAVIRLMQRELNRSERR
jgi:hypothetical protein